MEITVFWDVMLHSLVHLYDVRRYVLPPSSGYKSTLGRVKWYRYTKREHWGWGREQTNRSKENDEKKIRGSLRGLFYLKTEVAHSSETSVRIYRQYTVSCYPKQQ
jgi:hypothetical protein